jgi:hypothetical protein
LVVVALRVPVQYRERMAQHPRLLALNPQAVAAAQQLLELAAAEDLVAVAERLVELAMCLQHLQRKARMEACE